MDKLKQIALEYFEAHPKAKADATRKGMFLLRNEWRNTHHFEYRNGETKCWLCGRDWYSQEMDKCPGFHRSEYSTAQVVLSEEMLYQKNIARCEKLVRQEHHDWSTLTGHKIAILHHTYGCDPETLCWILGSEMPCQLRKEYELEMEKERSRSRDSQVKQVVSAEL